MSEDKSFRIDSREDVVYIVVSLFVGAVMAAVFTPVDAWTTFAIADTAAFLTPAGEADIVFDNEDVSLMNQHSEYAVGIGAFAGERLYCFNMVSNEATRFRSADFTQQSTLRSVSGSCTSPVEGFVHSQPDLNGQPSAEDLRLESDTPYQCIQYSAVTSSPITGQVSGLNCWYVSDGEARPLTVAVK